MIHLLLSLNILVALGITFFLILSFIKSRKNNHTKRIFFLFFLLGLIFLSCAILFFFWIFNLSNYNPFDFLFIQSILTFFEAVFLLIIIYFIRRNKKIFYLFFIYLFFILSLLLGLDFSNFLLLSSLSLIMILFILLISIHSFSRISRFAILYSSISLLLQISLILQKEFSPIFSLISNSFFFAFLLFFLADMKRFPFSSFEKKIKIKNNYYLFDFLRYFIFLVILTNFIFIGVIAVHEGGHFLMSKLNSECNLERIVYEGGLPHTEILCSNNPEYINKIILGGIFLPIILALLLFFGGGTFMKEISLLILGFNLFISYKDYLDLGFSQVISTFFSIFGGIVILLAIGILAKSRTTEEEFIHLGDS